MRVTDENQVVAFSRTEHDETEACSQIEETAEDAVETAPEDPTDLPEATEETNE